MMEALFLSQFLKAKLTHCSISYGWQSEECPQSHRLCPLTLFVEWLVVTVPLDTEVKAAELRSQPETPDVACRYVHPAFANRPQLCPPGSWLEAV